MKTKVCLDCYIHVNEKHETCPECGGQLGKTIYTGYIAVGN